MFRNMSRMPELSSWNTPVVLPLHRISKVGRSSNGKVLISSSTPRLFNSSIVLAITVSVLRPKKSNFTRPAGSIYFIENWVTGISERGSR